MNSRGRVLQIITDAGDKGLTMRGMVAEYIRRYPGDATWELGVDIELLRYPLWYIFYNCFDQVLRVCDDCSQVSRQRGYDSTCYRHCHHAWDKILETRYCLNCRAQEKM